MKVKELKAILESIDDDAVLAVHVEGTKKRLEYRTTKYQRKIYEDKDPTTVGYTVDSVKPQFGFFIFECFE